jgi:aldehyde oxidoreductase
MNDTAITPNTGPAGGSRSQVMAGQAIKAGCELLIEAMKKPDGSFRTYEEMVEEKLPLRYAGKWTAIDCTATVTKMLRAILSPHINTVYLCLK